MNIAPMNIDGVYELIPNVFEDERGSFIKVFNDDLYKKNNLNFNLREQYFSFSKKNVIRGMHFQLPPNDHDKLVYCIQGAVQDVVLDLRTTSKTYGEYCSIYLSSEKFNMLYIPSGFAHGFCSLTDDACMVYNVSSVYNPESDSGVAFNSFGYNWNISNPIVSDRDRQLSLFNSFKSPFLS
jgi:dTDP-4-dehydrorhamnose 3,5-epimerase